MRFQKSLSSAPLLFVRKLLPWLLEQNANLITLGRDRIIVGPADLATCCFRSNCSLLRGICLGLVFLMFPAMRSNGQDVGN